MSALFGNLTNNGLEESQDRLGGFRVRDTDAYTGTIKVAYAGVSSRSKAQSVSIILELEAGGEYRETFWVTNGEGNNYYLDKNDKSKKNPLPGFTIVDDICMVTTEKPLSQQTAEDKVINVYDPDQKKELPKSVPMLVDLLGKKVTLGIVKELKNKQVKDANDKYVDTADTREENTTDKVFHYPSNLTMVEARRGVTNAQFYGSWVEANRGKARDKRSIKDGAQNGQAGRPGAGGPPKANGAAKPATSLFAQS
jgi:hypothetical protein